MSIRFTSEVKRRLVIASAALTTVATAGDQSALVAQAWAIAGQRSLATVDWMGASFGSPGLYSQYPTMGNYPPGSWMTTTKTSDWRAGFWPGTLWLLAWWTGDPLWLQRAESWSAPLAASTNADHDIGFITLASLGGCLSFHDDLTDPDGSRRAFAKAAILTAAAKLDARFNQPNTSGTPVPADMTRSWNPPYQSPYPVCVDNLMNLEILFLAYELNGRQAADRPWFDHALTHARTSIARHLRPDGGTYHVVTHFEDGPHIGGIERKKTVQGYAHESTWSRGQAWAIHGLTTCHRYASRDSATDARDLLAAAQAAADYFLARLPHAFTADTYNHRIGDFVPPSDFDAAIGEPAGPWNDANDNYNPTTGTGLGDRKPALATFTLRDSSAAAVAASGLIELSRHVPTDSDRARYLSAAEDILQCLISYDGPDAGMQPDYLCGAEETDNPGILKAGSLKWGQPNRSLIYGDYYFLEALARYDALRARMLLGETQRAAGRGIEFGIRSPAPAIGFRVQRSSDLAAWTTVASKTGGGPWTGTAAVTEEALPDHRTRVTIADPSPGSKGFFRVLIRAAGGF